MAKSTRLLKSFYRLVFPVLFLIVAAVMAASVWFAHESSHPGTAAYLVTPDKYGWLSSRGAQVTEETWANRDGTQARGWLLRGAESAPAVVLLHKYGADRSHVLNLGVKLNEATNFTVLMPDQRGHGPNPPVAYTSFGGCEASDAGAAIEFLRGLKSINQVSLVGPDIGIYGLEMGSLAALNAATQDAAVKALVLDSVPADSDSLVASVIDKRFPFVSVITAELGQLGAYPYFYEGCYSRTPVCESAKALNGRKAMLLAGVDAPEFQESTSKLAKCFPGSSQTDANTALSPSGVSVINASIPVSSAYDQKVIDFFRGSLGAPLMIASETPQN
ncbi:MAG: alpha/beta hydrolase [Pyrinomonadaceae bacterium]